MIFWIILTIGFILALSVAHFKLGPLTVAIMVTLLVAFAVDRTRFLEIFIIHLSVIQWTLVSLGYAFLGLTWSFIEWRSHVRRIFNRLDISKYSKDLKNLCCCFTANASLEAFLFCLYLLKDK